MFLSWWHKSDQKILEENYFTLFLIYGWTGIFGAVLQLDLAMLGISQGHYSQGTNETLKLL